VGVLILAGTRKVLLLLKGGETRRGSEVEGPLLPGWEVLHATVGARSGTPVGEADTVRVVAAIAGG
jgi:hypothetical protein